MAVADNQVTPAAGNILAVADNPVTVIVADNVVAVADEKCDPTEKCDQSQADNHERQVHPIENLDDLLGQWCVVRYEGHIYPGIVLSTEGDDIEVKCTSAA